MKVQVRFIVYTILTIYFQDGWGTPIGAEVNVRRTSQEIDVSTATPVHTTEDTSAPATPNETSATTVVPVHTTEGTIPSTTTAEVTTYKAEISITEQPTTGYSTIEEPKTTEKSDVTAGITTTTRLRHPSGSKKPFTTPRHKSTTTPTIIKFETIAGPTPKVNCPHLSIFLSTIPTNEWNHLHVASGGRMKAGLKIKQFLELYGKTIMKDRYCTEQYISTVLPRKTEKELQKLDDDLAGMIEFRIPPYIHPH